MSKKEDPGVAIERRLFTNARERWGEFHGLTNEANVKSFANYLGLQRLDIKNIKPGTIMLRKSAVDKIMLLNSEHWYAILKAREAKRKTRGSILKKSTAL